MTTETRCCPICNTEFQPNRPSQTYCSRRCYGKTRANGEEPKKWYVRIELHGRVAYVREAQYREFCEQVHRMMAHAIYLEEHEVPVTVVPTSPVIIEQWRGRKSTKPVGAPECH
jgi:hypothetical protein